MPAAKPPEFRCCALDVVARGNPVGKVAKNPQISESCLRRWMSIDELDADRKEGLTSAERKALIELRHRNRDLEVSSSTYYEAINSQPSARAIEDQELTG